MGSDSLPIPYELWVWNLSSGNGNLQFLWNFGDGSTSTEAYPTHTYDGNGPYNLCLQIFDNGNCTSVHCDSISINGDGMYEGMIVHAEDRQEGFTINVQQGQSTAVQEVVTNSTIATWPNPAVDELNVAVVSAMKGNVTVTITDLDGRTVKTERTSLGGGRSKLRIATSGLNAGMYMLRITDGSVNVSQRFAKDWTVQLNGEYEGDRPIPQGHSLPQYGMDASVARDVTKRLNVVAGVNDVFDTRSWGSVYDTPTVYQESYRRRDQRNFRITLTWKFGEQNSSLFRRRNANPRTEPGNTGGEGGDL
jgi:PKD repeat protein